MAPTHLGGYWPIVDRSIGLHPEHPVSHTLCCLVAALLTQCLRYTSCAGFCVWSFCGTGARGMKCIPPLSTKATFAEKFPHAN